MGKLVLQGDTLGERHQHYNTLVKKALVENSSDLSKINIEDNDVDNLFKIDIACSNRNVDYILEVLKSEDMLYVSRAIKGSTWLITDPQYAHIIDPQYLHSQLFPQMITKARNKFMLHIRLHLKDESRANIFYDYYKEKNATNALKWLPYCPLDVIEKAAETLEKTVDVHVIKRLSERSFTVLEKHMKKCDWTKRNVMTATMFLLNNHTEKYLDILDTLDIFDRPNLGAKATAVVMKKCPQRIIDDFEKFCFKIDLPIFAKHLKNTNIKAFLLKYFTKESMRNWFRIENLKHFIRYIPREGRFEFLKKVFIDKSGKNDNEVGDGSNSDFVDDDFCKLESVAMPCSNAPSSNAHIYRWYEFASFEVAFPELKKLIRTESSPNERYAILAVLLNCAGRNMHHIDTLLQYYHDKHINEPFKFKLQFVNMVLSQTNTHEYSEKMWNNLNNIFYSMEVYIESENNVQLCVQSIIVYKVLHSEKVPDIITKKFLFDTLKSIQNKLNKEENEKVFNHLYNILVNKINNKIIENDTTYAEVVQLVEDILTLLLNWKRELANYPWVVNKIKDLSSMKKQKLYKTDLSCLYNKNKSWRKHMFEESLTMFPCESVCINALKHDPNLLVRYREEVEALCQNDAISLREVLDKLRIYWSDSLANEWAASYLNRLNSPTGHKALVNGICSLIPQKQMLCIVKKFAPTETKINWSEDDEYLLSLRKQIAKNLYLARPLPPPDAILLYAHGDYLQYALPSLNAICYNLSSVNSRVTIPKLLAAPVSLQKHGIRLAFTKLESKELKQIFHDIWKSTKNSTIRAVLFQQTYKLLCMEKNPSMIQDIWELLSMFIDNLSTDESRQIYTILGKVEKVPLSVRAEYCMKGYKYLKSLPTKTNCESILTNIIYYTNEIMEHLNPNFVADILLENLDKKFTTKSYELGQVMAPYLLCSSDTVSQMEKYVKVLEPVLDRALSLWNVKIDESYVVRNNVTSLLRDFSRFFQKFVFEKKMVFPVTLFTQILDKLEARLKITTNYVTLRTWRFTVNYVKQLEMHKNVLTNITPKETPSDNCYGPLQFDMTWHEIHTKSIPGFVANCVENLKHEMKLYFPSIYCLFGKALENMFTYMDLNRMVYLETLMAFLDYKDFIEGHLMVLKVMPKYFYNPDEDKIVFEKIQKKILLHESEEIKMNFCLEFDQYDMQHESK